MFGLDLMQLLFPLSIMDAQNLAPISTTADPVPAEPDAPAPTVCGSCGSKKNEHGELPCGH